MMVSFLLCRIGVGQQALKWEMPIAIDSRRNRQEGESSKFTFTIKSPKFSRSGETVLDDEGENSLAKSTRVIIG